MHEEPLPECKVKWEEVKKHHDDSVGVRTSVDKSGQQILTLEKAHEATMQDIKEIKSSIVSINKRIDDGFSGIKIWILTAAVSGLIVLVGEALYFGGVVKQIDVNTLRLNVLEELHPRISK